MGNIPSASPAVYVGTYGKYNAGDLNGAWVNLANFSTYSEFIQKCKEIHSDESDPEFMFQDYENMPDGLSVPESFFSEEDFNDIMAAYRAEVGSNFKVIDYSEKALALVGDTKPIAEDLKALGGKFNPRLKCGAGWIFSKSKESALRAYLGGAKVETGEAAEAVKSDLTELLDMLKDDKFYSSYYAKELADAVKLDDGSYYLVEKPRIETRFCFHDEGPEYEFYKNMTSSEDKIKAYFLSRNLSDFDRRFEDFKEGKAIYTKAYTRSHGIAKSSLHAESYYVWRPEELEGARQLTAEEVAKIRKSLENTRQGFEKRLHSYLKRYGIKKLNMWTYWAEA